MVFTSNRWIFIFPRVTHLLKKMRKLEIFKREGSLSHKVIGSGKSNEVSKKAHGSVELANEPRKPKESKRAVDAQRKVQKDIGAHK